MLKTKQDRHAIETPPQPDEVRAFVRRLKQCPQFKQKYVAGALLERLITAKLEGSATEFSRETIVTYYRVAKRDSGAGRHHPKAWESGFNGGRTGSRSPMPANPDEAAAFQEGLDLGASEARAAGAWSDEPSRGVWRSIEQLVKEYFSDKRLEAVPLDEQPEFIITFDNYEPIIERNQKFPASVVPEAKPEDETRSRDRLAALLNNQFGFLNDSLFGQNLAEYLVAQATHKVYCAKLETTLTLDRLELNTFPALPDEASLKLLSRSAVLHIHEKVQKSCVANSVTFLVQRETPRGLDPALHFANVEYDFVWNLDLPEGKFEGNISDLFSIDMLSIDGQDVEPQIIEDDNEAFAFTAPIPSDYDGQAQVNLEYKFATITRRNSPITYGNRFLTKDMTVACGCYSASGMEVTGFKVHHTGERFYGGYEYDPFPRREHIRRGRANGGEGLSYKVFFRGWLLPGRSLTFSLQDNITDGNSKRHR